MAEWVEGESPGEVLSITKTRWWMRGVPNQSAARKTMRKAENHFSPKIHESAITFLYSGRVSCGRAQGALPCRRLFGQCHIRNLRGFWDVGAFVFFAL